MNLNLKSLKMRINPRSLVTNYSLVKSKEKKKYFVPIRWFEQPLAYCTICAFE